MEQDVRGVPGISPDPTLQEEDYRRHLSGLNENKPTVTEFLHAQPRAVFEPVVVKKEIVYREVYVREPDSLVERIRITLRIIYFIAQIISILVFAIFLFYWFAVICWLVFDFLWAIYG
jgi:hypothetical protein